MSRSLALIPCLLTLLICDAFLSLCFVSLFDGRSPFLIETDRERDPEGHQRGQGRDPDSHESRRGRPTFHPLHDPLDRANPPGMNRFSPKVSLHVVRQFAGSEVTAMWFLLEAFQADRLQVAR